MKLVPDWVIDICPRAPWTAKLVMGSDKHDCCGSPLTAEHRPECDHAEHLLIIDGKPAYRTKAQMRAAL